MISSRKGKFHFDIRDKKVYFFSFSSVQLAQADERALEYISTVGCFISFIALLFTMLLTLLFWRKLKSARTKVLLNLCLSLAAACLLVIIEGSARVHKVSAKLGEDICGVLTFRH